MSFASDMESKGISSLSFSQKNKRDSPLWDGPESDKPNGGVTFSLLNRFLQCRERFRLYVVEGLKPTERFNHKSEYGNMWHVCEESHLSNNDWQLSLKDYVTKLCNKYKVDQPQILQWYNVCKVQFPIYLKYWEAHPDIKDKTNLLQEVVFSVPLTLPSGRVVYLRGKWDSVDYVKSGNKGVWLQENKTKGDVKPELLRRQLTFDLQTMLYAVALDQLAPVELGIACRTREIEKDIEKYKLRGIRYNIVRRPLSGGKHTIKPHKAKGKKPAEKMSDFYTRLAERIENDPEFFFMRFNVQVKEQDIKKFLTQCLYPILEQLCDWWNWIKSKGDNPFSPEKSNLSPQLAELYRLVGNFCHYRMPFGIRQLEEGMSTDLDEYMDSGSDVGLNRVDSLFPELEY